MTPRPLLFLACLAPLWLGSATASAQDAAAADALFNKAVADMEAGRYDVACPALAESQRLDPHSGTLFTMGTCNARAGKIATASSLYDEYLRSVVGLPPATRAKHADRMKLARADLDRLRPQIPTLQLVVPAAAGGTRVRRDGVELPAASVGSALPIDPGEHTITVEAPGHAKEEQRVTVERGQHKVLEVALGAVETPASGEAPVPAAGAATPATGDPGSGRRLGAYVAGGAGAALFLVGAVTGGLALSKKSAVTADCPALACSPAGETALNAGKTLGTVSTVGFVVGAAGLAAGAVLFFTAPRAPRAEDKAARWDGGVVAGPGGFAASVRGAW